jgi:hypothetical protein
MNPAKIQFLRCELSKGLVDKKNTTVCQISFAGFKIIHTFAM